MDSISPVHWIIVLAPVIALQAVPILRILKRAGLSGWWTVAYFVPLFGWLSLWLFAFSSWPAVDSSSRAPSADAGGVGL